MRAVCVLLVLTVSAGAALADDPSKKAETSDAPISVAGQADLPVIAVDRVTDTIADGDKLGELRTAWSCGLAGPFRWTSKLAEVVAHQIKVALPRELERAGYRVKKKSDSAFNSESLRERADLEIGAVVKSFSLNVCVYVSGALHGSADIGIKWELLNAKAQKVVFSAETEGSFRREDSEKETIPDFYDRAIVAAARKLLSNKDFVAAVTHPGTSDANAASGSTYDFANSSPPAGGAEKNSTQLRAAVVTIETAAGSGSGFYIDRGGYLLTNQHVIGDSKFVKVRTATGRELPGEVLRVDARRDVALLKTESTPFDPLAIRTGETHVGEDVYAVGSPFGDTFNGSMTKGVLSGDRNLDNRRFLQSDVSILPGSSGGPLLDATGSVIGIADIAADAGRANLNLFVPIGEALESVAVKLH